MSPRSAWIGVAATFVASPLPYYTFRRPLMAHSGELLSLALFAWSSVLFFKNRGAWRAFAAGFLFALAACIRYPNTFVALGWLVGLYFSTPSKQKISGREWFFFLFGISGPVLFHLIAWKLSLGTWVPTRGIYSLHPGDTMHYFSLNPKTLSLFGAVLVGPGWGLLWMETPVVLALWSLKDRSPWSPLLRWAFFGLLPL